MKNVILAITMLFFGGSFTDMEENDLALQGVWQEATNPEFVRIGSSNMIMKFQRVQGKDLVSHGTFTTEDGTMFVSNEFSNSEYELQYVFSPSGQTLVVTKPNSDEAWVFFRVGQ